MGTKRLLAAAACTAALVGVSAGPAFAGEITGNGRVKDVNGKSACAYSGQEDLQWYASNGDNIGPPLANPVKGVPAHSQNWGQIVSAAGGHLGGAVPAGCNPHVGE